MLGPIGFRLHFKLFRCRSYEGVPGCFEGFSEAFQGASEGLRGKFLRGKSSEDSRVCFLGSQTATGDSAGAVKTK